MAAGLIAAARRALADDRRRAALAVAGVLLLLAFAGQGARALWDPDEGRYSNVALGMLESGDWVTPRLDEETPHFSKPPITYWAIAASVAVLGHHETAVRLPNALAYLATVLLVVAIARRLVPGCELTAGAVQATSLLPFVAANIVTSDTLLALWETLAVFAFVEHRWGEPGRRRWILLMWIALGLAFMTKGPPGLLPLLAIVYFVAREDGLRGVVRVFRPVGVALFLVVGGSWYVAVILRQPDLLAYFLRDEVVARVASGNHDRNAGLVGLARAYLPVILLGPLPWLGFAVPRLVRTWRERRSFSSAGDPRRRLVAAWLVLPLLVFFATSSRLPLYLVPLAPPASLALAAVLGPARGDRRTLRRFGGWVAFLLVLRVAATLYPSDRDGRRLAAALRPALPVDVREIAFVDRKPRYTLRFYLHREVEDVHAWAPGVEAPRYRRRETLDEELAEREAGVLFIVAPRESARVEAELARHGWQAQRLTLPHPFDLVGYVGRPGASR